MSFRVVKFVRVGVIKLGDKMTKLGIEFWEHLEYNFASTKLRQNFIECRVIIGLQKFSIDECD